MISVSFCAFKHEQIHLSPNKCAIFGQIWSISIYIHFDWSIRILFGALYLHGDAYSHICQNFWVSFCLDLSFSELHSCWVSSILSRTLLQTMQMTLITSLEKSTWAKGWDVLPCSCFFLFLLCSQNDRGCTGLGSSGKGEVWVCMSASARGGSSFCHLWFCPCMRGAVEGFWEWLASLSNGGNPQTTMSEFALKLVNLYSYVGSVEMRTLWELSSLATAWEKQGKQTSWKGFCNWHCVSELIYFHDRNNHAIKTSCILLESSLVRLQNWPVIGVD